MPRREGTATAGSRTRQDRAVTDMTVAVPIRLLDPDLPVPTYAHPSDAGADLFSAEDVVLAAGGGRALVRTGVAVALPGGYRGEILVNLVNHDPVAPAKISRGDRIAQLVVQRVERADFHIVEELPESRRGAGGHGSTGT